MAIQDILFFVGTIFILGGICLNGVPCGMLMRNPQYLPRTPTDSLNCSASKGGLEGTPLITVEKSISSRFGFHLLKDWKFVVYLSSMSLIYVSHETLHWFIPDRAVEIGLSNHDAALTVTVMNLANIISRLIFGLVSFNTYFNCIVLLMFYVFISGLNSLLVFAWTTFWSYIFFAVMFGLLRGLFVIYHLLVLVHLVGKEQVDLALGLIFVGTGFLMLIAIPIFGHYNEVTLSYTTTFVLYGSTELIGGCLLASIPFNLLWNKIKG